VDAPKNGTKYVLGTSAHLITLEFNKILAPY